MLVGDVKCLVTTPGLPNTVEFNRVNAYFNWLKLSRFHFQEGIFFFLLQKTLYLSKNIQMPSEKRKQT